MDPVSILGIVSGASTVAKLLSGSAIHLALFIKDARGVNETVEALRIDVLGLEQALNSVKQLSNKIPATSLKSLQDKEYLTQLSDSVKSCETIAGALSSKVSKLTPPKRLSNPFAKAKLHISVILNEDQIKELRIQADGEKQDIQTALQLLHMSSTTRSEATLDTIREEMYRLTAMIIGMRRYHENVAASVSLHSVATERALQGNRELVRSAQQALSKAGSTLAGSAIGDDISSTIFNRLETPEILDPTRIEKWIAENSTQDTSAAVDDSRTTESDSATLVHKQTKTDNPQSVSLEMTLLILRDRGYIAPKMAQKMITEFRFVVKSKDVREALDHALYSASSKGDYTSVQDLLRSGASPNVRLARNNNATALIQAVKGNHTQVVKYLLCHGSDIEESVVGDLHLYLRNTSQMSLQFPTWAEYSAVSYAAAFGFVSTMEVLIAHQPDLDHSQNKTMMSPVHLAAHEGHASVVQLLLSAGASPTRDIELDHDGFRRKVYQLHVAFIAAQQGHCEVLKIWRGFQDEYNSASGSAGRRAVLRSDRNLTKAVCTFRNKCFTGSMFHAAATISHSRKVLQEVFELLTDWGFDINEPYDTPDGWLPLHVAVHCENPEAVRLLIRYGANVNLKSTQGYTAMHRVMITEKNDKESMTESLKILRVLLEDDGDPNIVVAPWGYHNLGTPIQVREAELNSIGHYYRGWRHRIQPITHRDEEWHKIEWNGRFTKEAEKLIKQYESPSD